MKDGLKLTDSHAAITPVKRQALKERAAVSYTMSIS